MRLFVQIFLVLIVVTVLLVSYITTTNAVSQEVLVAEPVCYFEALDFTQSISAGSWQIINIETGEVLAQYEPNKVFPAASIVKLITAHLVQQEADIFTATTALTVGDIETEGRSGNLQVGEVYTPHELLFPLLLTSSNDAGAALDRIYPGLLSGMRKFTLDAGAVNSNIADTTGLSNHNKTTASDLSLLLRQLYLHSAHTFDITRVSLLVSRYENGWLNNIPFRNLPGYKGGKQGYTVAAKQTGVAVFDIGEVRSIPVGIVILFSTNVARDMTILHDAITKSYKCEFASQ